MSPILRGLKFAWDYFVCGRHRIPSVSAQSDADWRAKLDWHDDPLVGRYVRTKIGTWWADARLESLGYELRLLAPGSGPTADQMARFKTLIERIPEMVAVTDLEPIPKDDGWGHKPPPFDIRTARISSIGMEEDGAFYLIFDVDADGVYMLSPVFTVSSDYTVTSAEWSV